MAELVRVRGVWKGRVEPVNYSRREFLQLFNTVAYYGACFGNAVMRFKALFPEMPMAEVAKRARESVHERAGKTFRELLPDAIRGAYYFSEFKGKTTAREFRRFEISIPTFRTRGKKLSIPFRDRGWQFVDTDENIIRLTMFPQGDDRPAPLLRITGGYRRSRRYAVVLERLKSGEWQPGSLRLVKDFGQFYAHISYSFTRRVREGPYVMGMVVDADALRDGQPFVYCTFEGVQKGKVLYGDVAAELVRIRAVLTEKMRAAQELITKRYRRRGHGKTYKFRPLRRFSRKWEGAVQHRFSKVANDLCKRAAADDVAAVGLVCLTRKDEETEVRLPIHRLMATLKYKLERDGVQVFEIGPTELESICARCGGSIKYSDGLVQCDCGLKEPYQLNMAGLAARRGRDRLSHQG